MSNPVFCEDCKYYSMTSAEGIPVVYHNCKNKHVVKILMTALAEVRILGDPLEHNANNDCKHYKPSLWCRIKNLFK